MIPCVACTLKKLSTAVVQNPQVSHKAFVYRARRNHRLGQPLRTRRAERAWHRQIS